MSITPFPPVDPSEVRPDMEEVGLLLMTRTVDQDTGVEAGTFTPSTRPSEAQVDGLIDQAVETVLGRLPAAVDPGLYPAIQAHIALRVAILVEFSFYREQLVNGPMPSLLDVLKDDALVLAARAHGGPVIR